MQSVEKREIYSHEKKILREINSIENKNVIFTKLLS